MTEYLIYLSKMKSFEHVWAPFKGWSDTKGFFALSATAPAPAMGSLPQAQKMPDMSSRLLKCAAKCRPQRQPNPSTPTMVMQTGAPGADGQLGSAVAGRSPLPLTP